MGRARYNARMAGKSGHCFERCRHDRSSPLSPALPGSPSRRSWGCCRWRVMRRHRHRTRPRRTVDPMRAASSASAPFAAASRRAPRRLAEPADSATLPRERSRSGESPRSSVRMPFERSGRPGSQAGISSSTDPRPDRDRGRSGRPDPRFARARRRSPTVIPPAAGLSKAPSLPAHHAPADLNLLPAPRLRRLALDRRPRPGFASGCWARRLSPSLSVVTVSQSRMIAGRARPVPALGSENHVFQRPLGPGRPGCARTVSAEEPR